MEPRNKEDLAGSEEPRNKEDLIVSTIERIQDDLDGLWLVAAQQDEEIRRLNTRLQTVLWPLVALVLGLVAALAHSWN